MQRLKNILHILSRFRENEIHVKTVCLSVAYCFSKCYLKNKTCNTS